MLATVSRLLLPLSALALGACGSATDRTVGAAGAESVVRQIDHILIESGDAPGLFSLFSDTLQLPVAWPMSDYGTFASGGVAVGNVNIEVLRSVQQRAGAPRARIAGFALEPEPLADSLLELRARGVSHGAPAPYRAAGPGGLPRMLWTTVGLPSVSDDAVTIFFCQYEHDVPGARRQLLEELESRRGGPLAARSVAEVVYGAVDAEAMRERWQALLDPLEPSAPGLWSVGAGPAIRVVSADRNGIRRIVIEVASLAQARAYLAENGLLGADRSDEILMASPELEGVEIALSE